MRHAHHEAGDIRLHVAESGAGPPLVLLHGWPQHWYEWRDVIPALASDYRVLCPDLRGFGWSDAPPGGYDKETMARDILALLDRLGIERCNLVGHDWGGWIGFLICLFAPERVERYLALNIALPFSPPTTSSGLDLWRLWYQWLVGAPVVGERAVSWLAAHPQRAARLSRAGWDEDVARSFFDQFTEPARARASAQLYRTFQLRELPRVVAGRYRRMRLQTKTLMLHGVGDPIIRPRNLRGYERYADDMSVELVEDSGHFIVDEKPELIVSRARSFFR